MRRWKIVSAAIVDRRVVADLAAACGGGADDQRSRGREAWRIGPSRSRTCNIGAGIVDRIIATAGTIAGTTAGRGGARWACRRRRYWRRHRQQSGTGQ